jgi:hypothetical protein
VGQYDDQILRIPHCLMGLGHGQVVILLTGYGPANQSLNLLRTSAAWIPCGLVGLQSEHLRLQDTNLHR